MAKVVPTRQKLIEAGMRLFAQRGFHATSVGDIEAAVGLQPRRGALYKHFSSKQALLEAAVRAYLDDAATGAAQLSDLDFGDVARADRGSVRPLTLALGRWFLGEMDRLKDLTRVLEHDGRRMRKQVRAVKTEMVDLSYRSATLLISSAGTEVADPEATAVLILGSLVALRRTAWTFGSSPLGIDDDRALKAWVELTLATLNAARRPVHR